MGADLPRGRRGGRVGWMRESGALDESEAAQEAGAAGMQTALWHTSASSIEQSLDTRCSSIAKHRCTRGCPAQRGPAPRARAHLTARAVVCPVASRSPRALDVRVRPIACSLSPPHLSLSPPNVRCGRRSRARPVLPRTTTRRRRRSRLRGLPPKTPSAPLLCSVCSICIEVRPCVSRDLHACCMPCRFSKCAHTCMHDDRENLHVVVCVFICCPQKSFHKCTHQYPHPSLRHTRCMHVWVLACMCGYLHTHVRAYTHIYACDPCVYTHTYACTRA